MYSRHDLAAGFRALGVMPGDTIMLHASVRAVGPVAGGPDEIHLALKDALTTAGTLMMLAGCPEHYDDVGRGHLSAEEELEILEKLPAFNPETARCDRSNGILVEFLRSYPESIVSTHPTRFVAWGARAESLVNPQPWNHAFGTGSALDRLLQRNGKILLLGSDHDTVTFLHHAEYLVDIPDKRLVRCRVPVQENGQRVWRDMEEYDSSRGAHANWSTRFFAEIVDSYLRAAGNSGARVGNAETFLFPAGELLDFALPVMKAVAADTRALERLAEGRV